MFEIISSYDTLVLAKIVAVRSDGATIFFNAMTWLGEWYVAAVIILVMTLVFLYYKQFFLVLPFWFATGGATTVTTLLKNFIERPRPELGLFTESLYSMPSFHATIAIALYGFLAWYLYRSEKKRWLHFDVWILWALVLLISFSRLYLGVHWPSDVLVGLFIGGVFLFIAVSFANIMARGKETKFQNFSLKKK